MKRTVLHTQLRPNVPFDLPVHEKARLSMASLDHNAKPGMTVLYVIVKGTEYPLCTLTRDGINQELLNVYFTSFDAPTLLLRGVNDMYLTYVQFEQDRPECTDGVNVIDYEDLLSVLDKYDDEDDKDDTDEEEEEEEVVTYSGRHMFRDISDDRFLGGFELRHFGLAPQISFHDKIDLRKEETSEDDKELHDNILRGLINSMFNSGDACQIRKAKELLKSIERSSEPTTSSNNVQTPKDQSLSHGEALSPDQSSFQNGQVTEDYSSTKDDQSSSNNEASLQGQSSSQNGQVTNNHSSTKDEQSSSKENQPLPEKDQASDKVQLLNDQQWSKQEQPASKKAQISSASPSKGLKRKRSCVKDDEEDSDLQRDNKRVTV